MQIPSDILCPISREIYEAPLLCADGFTYEKSFIIKWIGEHKLSPMLGNELTNTSLLENKTLFSYLTAYKGMKQRLINSRHKPKERKVEEEHSAEAKEKLEQALNHYYKATLELNECCKQMEILSNTHPNNFEITTNYANMLRFAGKFDKSLSVLKSLKMIQPNSLVPQYMKVRVLSESGSKQKANELLRKMQNRHKIEDHHLLEIRFMSYSILSVGDRDTAYKVVMGYLSLLPTDFRALSHCIYVNLLLEDFKYVIKASLSYLKNHPDDVSVMFHLAKAYVKIDEKTKAIELYKQIISIATDKAICSKALYESAVNKDCNKEFKEMVQELEESYRLDPREEADGYLAALYADKKMYKEAERWMKEYEKRMNILNDQVFLGIKAQIQENSKEYEDAVATYTRLLEIDRVNSTYYNRRIEAVIKRKMQELH